VLACGPPVHYQSIHHHHLPVLEHLVDISADTRFSDVAALFRAAVALDPTRPLLTYYDDATGERTELSGATADNWVAKTANLLVDGLGLRPGALAAVVLPPHWQTAAVLIGSWSAGLAVGTAGLAGGGPAGNGPAGSGPTGSGPAGSGPAGSGGGLAGSGGGLAGGGGALAGGGGPADVGFVAADRLDEAPDANDLFVLGLAPMAMPLREVPAGFVDFVAEVRGHGDHFRPYAPIRGSDPALADGTPHDELCRLARDRAEQHGLGPTDRVLVDVNRLDNPLGWLLTPLAAGASIVLCANLDPAQLPGRRDSERVTRVLD
jgi:hypothetical protein